MLRLLRPFLALSLCLGVAQAQVVQVAPIPAGAQINVLTGSATGTTGSIAATLTGAAGKWTYVCGFTITSASTTSAAAVTATLTGTVTATMSFIYTFVSSGQGVLGVAFPGCISSSAVNTSIAINVPAGGTGTVVAANIWGYTN